MSILKIASALPLVVGIACSTSGSEVKDHTGAMWKERKAASSEVSMQGTGSGGSQESAIVLAAGGSSDTGPSSSGSSGSGSMGSSGSTDSGGSMGSSGSGGSSGSMGSGSSDSPGSTPGGGAMGSGGSSETMGSQPEKGASETAASPDTGAGAATGAGEKAHAEDEWVKGKVSKISKTEITITPKGGETKTLKIAKETVVTVNGKDAKPSQVKQGQQVRASYTNEAGEDVATKIEVGKMRQGQHPKPGGHMMKGGSSGSDTGSSGMGGPSGSSGSGSGSSGMGGPSGGSETK